MTPDLAWPERPEVSAAAERLYARMAAYQDGDEQTGWKLLQLCEARARMNRRATELLRHDEHGSGVRRRHDPRRCPAVALPSLAARLGVDAAGLTEQQLRTAIEKRPRTTRCTPEAMLAAVLATLTPDAVEDDVRILENDGGAYKLTLITQVDQTPHPAVTKAAALTQKPLFVRLTHIVTNSPRIDDWTLPIDDVDVAIDDLTIDDVT